MVEGLVTLRDFNWTLMGLGTVLDFNMAVKGLETLAVKGLETLWDLNTTLFWMPSADAGLRERDRQSIYMPIFI